MKYSAHAYAKAFVDAMAAAKGKEVEEAMAKNFLALVRRNGDEANLPKILSEADRLMRASNRTRRLVVESARRLDIKARAFVASIANAGDTIEEKVDLGFIAGIKITANDEMQFDASLQKKLDSIFGAVE